MDFAIRSDYADYLIKTVSEKILAALDTLLEEHGDGIDIVYMADDYCSQQGPLFSPDMFKQYVQPYLKEVAARCHKHDKKFLLHCCGAVRPLLPMIIDAGVDMLEPIQIRAEGMEPAGLKRDFGKHLCFYGGVDLQHILPKGTPQQVADEVRRLDRHPRQGRRLHHRSRSHLHPAGCAHSQYSYDVRDRRQYPQCPVEKSR